MAKPLIKTAIGSGSKVCHVKIEDGPGQPLGRSFRVKLWPTLVFLLDGVEVDRVTRPSDLGVISQSLERLRVQD